MYYVYSVVAVGYCAFMSPTNITNSHYAELNRTVSNVLLHEATNTQQLRYMKLEGFIILSFSMPYNEVTRSGDRRMMILEGGR